MRLSFMNLSVFIPRHLSHVMIIRREKGIRTQLKTLLKFILSDVKAQ